MPADSGQIALGGNPRERVSEFPEVNENLVAEGVSPRVDTFTAQVKDDTGQPLIQSAASSVTISIPGDPESLKGMSKGPITKAATWFATFWLRVIKKAAHYGWQIVSKN